MSGQQNLQTMGISLYPKQRQVVEAYAKENGYSLALALRRIIDEWTKAQMAHYLPPSEVARLTQFEDA